MIIDFKIKQMRFLIKLLICITTVFLISCSSYVKKERFPDGTIIPAWFSDTSKLTLSDLGKPYIITNYGVIRDSMLVQTKAIQQVIDNAAKAGGGVIIIPEGVFLSGALFFKPGTALYLDDKAVLKGSDTIADYPIMPSRIEGQNLDYYPALINADGVDGFSISGKGTINGNGERYWNAFWRRRNENPDCTNLEVSRPRLIFIQNSNNVQLQDIRLLNAGFWSSHYYKCNQVKIIGLSIKSPYAPVKAPSTDAIDIDACSNVLIKDCYMSVNDDAIALKGRKGPLADKDSDNGENTNIIVEDCSFGFCHAALTLGSESIHNRNIIMRNCVVTEASRLLWLKLRGDTPQLYEFITLENISGNAQSFLYAKPWTQFFDLQGKTMMPTSICENITLRNIDFKCAVFFNVKTDESNCLKHFVFENLNIEAENDSVTKSYIYDLTLNNVVVNNRLVK